MMVGKALERACVCMQPRVQTLLQALVEVAEEANRNARAGYRLCLGPFWAPPNGRKFVLVSVQRLILQEAILS